jgi:hypothetical protein
MYFIYMDQELKPVFDVCATTSTQAFLLAICPSLSVFSAFSLFDTFSSLEHVENVRTP